MQIDDRSLREFTERSQDLQTDALRGSRSAVADLADLRADRRGNDLPDPDQLAAYDLARRGVLQRLGLVGAGAATKAMWAGGIGSALVALLGRPASANEALDLQMLNTASSLENLAVATYEAALGLDFIKNGNKTIVAFAKTTMSQHAEHSAAFNAQAVALGGKEQTGTNTKFTPIVEAAKPKLKSPLDVVQLAATLEEVAAETYLVDLPDFVDKKSVAIMGSVLGVEVQHLATLKAVEALLMADAESLVAVPTDLAKLPAAAGSVGFKDGAFLEPTTDTVAPPESGAVQ